MSIESKLRAVIVCKLRASEEQFEFAIRNSEKRFELAIRGSNDGLWDWDLETDVVCQSPRFRQMLGFEANELDDSLGIGFGRIHPDDLERVLAQIVAYLGKKIPQFESTFRIKHKNGCYFWVMSRAVAVWNAKDRALRMVGTYTDLTTLSLTEESLQRSEEKYRHIVESSQEGIWIVDNRAITTYVNAGMARMLGYSHEEILGQSIFNFMDEVTRQEAKLFFECREQNKGMSEVHDFRFQRKDGSELWVIVSTTASMDKDGRFSNSLGMVTDITERKHSERELKHAKQTAEIANRAKSIFLANMSHELRTPLNGILGYAQILNNQGETLTEDQRQSVVIIQQSGEYLLSLIDDILDLARVEAGKIELSPTIVVLKEFLQEIAHLFELRAEQKGILFSYQPLSELPVAIQIDGKRLRQVLINLLGNAFKFVQQGHITLKVTYAQEELHFHIEDSGCGIAPDDLEKIFTPFQQIGSEVYRKQGTGLGLSITKGLVEVMGGTLHVTSVLGQGSTFLMSFKLPEVSGMLLQPGCESPLCKIIGYQGTRRRVLIIDDNLVNRSFLIKMLGSLGFTVLEAEDGQEGLNEVNESESSPFDLILVDLVMPGLNGFSVIEQLKTNPHCQNAVVIAVSASAFDLDRQQSLQLGCNAFIAKPIKYNAFLECLQVHLNLTWIYESETAIVNASSSELPTTQLTSSQAADLLELIKQGDIIAICDFAKQLEQADEELAAVARYIHELAVQFKTNEIRKIVEKQLT